MIRMSALMNFRPRLLQITSVAAKRQAKIQEFSSERRRRSEDEVLPTDPGVKPFKSIPGPPSLPIVGTIPWYFFGIYDPKRPYETYSGFLKDYGSLVKEDLFFRSSIVHVFDPKDIRKIYQDEKGAYPVRISHRALQKHREARKEMYGHVGVAPSNKAEWKKYRDLLGPWPTHYEKYINKEAFEMIADELIEYFKTNRDSKQEIALLPALYYFTLECIGVVTIGLRMGCFDPDRREDISRFIEAAHETHYAIYETEINPAFLVRKYFKRLDVAQEYIGNFTLQHMNNIKERMDLASIKNTDPFDVKREDEDFAIDDDASNPVKVSKCLMYDKLKKGLSQRMILPMASDFFQGGIHSTAHSMTFALYHLALNPDKQDILRKRLQDGDHKYLECVINESLRLNPAAIGTGRVLNFDHVLSGYLVPKGTKVIIHQEVAAKNEAVYPEPNRFMPERMEGKLNTDQRYAFRPFIDMSTRICLGRSIALTELEIALRKIVLTFKLTYHRKRVGVRNFLLNEPDEPIYLKFEDISSSLPQLKAVPKNNIAQVPRESEAMTKGKTESPTSTTEN